MTPNFEITKKKNQLGCLQGKYNHYNGRIGYTLKVSNYYDRTEKQYDNTIIHEMIHLYIEQNHIIDNGSHGRRFKAECERINKYGWDLSARTNVSDWKLSEEAEKKEARKKAKGYHIIVYKEVRNGSQFFMKTSQNNVYRYKNYIENTLKAPCRSFHTFDDIFEWLPKCTSRIRGKRVYENELNSEFAPYLIRE